MTVMPEQMFKMLIGTGFKWQLSYVDKNKTTFQPYVRHIDTDGYQAEVQFKLSPYGLKIIAAGYTLVNLSKISGVEYKHVNFTSDQVKSDEP